jgi:hypothetical protein
MTYAHIYKHARTYSYVECESVAFVPGGKYASGFLYSCTFVVNKGRFQTNLPGQLHETQIEMWKIYQQPEQSN